MLKIVVYDCGFGGELLADRLEQELPVAEIIRVIDWRHAEDFLSNPHTARRLAESALLPYIGNVNLIIFANHLLSLTSLAYFKRKYRNQLFTGIKLIQPHQTKKHRILLLTTDSLTRTKNYYNYLFKFNIKSRHTKIKPVRLDRWPALIDDGELKAVEIAEKLGRFKTISPDALILGCSNFVDIKSELRNVFGRNIKIYDGFDDLVCSSFKLLKVRGGTGRKAS